MTGSPVDWRLAERVAVRAAGREPFAESYLAHSLQADFDDAQLGMQISLGLGLALAGVGAALLLTGDDREPAAAPGAPTVGGAVRRW